MNERIDEGSERLRKIVHTYAKKFSENVNIPPAAYSPEVTTVKSLLLSVQHFSIHF